MTTSKKRQPAPGKGSDEPAPVEETGTRHAGIAPLISTPEKRGLIITLPGSAKAAWTAAAVVIAISLIATFTVAQPGTENVAAQGPASDDFFDDEDFANSDGASVVDEGSGDAQAGRSVRRRVGGSAAGPAADPGASDQQEGGGAGTGSAQVGGDGGPTGAATYECAPGRNGGKTDVGVSGDEIKVAATVVKSGIGRAFLGDVEFGMKAVMDKVNRAGGICGRELSLKLVDDGWKASEGQQAIKRFIDEGYFALAVVPSSEGLRQATGDVERAGIPVVGTDGMLAHQYTDRWIWPVATSTISTMHIMAKNAHDRGARTFGLVYDQNYRFGVEGAAAFRAALKRLPGTELKADVGIQAGQSSYKNTINNDFNAKCGVDQAPKPSDCDFVALLLEPDTAITWISEGGYMGTGGKAVGAGGPQTLFGDQFAEDFASNCPSPCNTQFWIWTGFKPPLPPFDTDPAVQTYVDDMKATNSSADRVNQFVEGGYDGMLLLVDGLKKVGPNLTRERLRAALDSMCFDSGLATPRCFQEGDHFANLSMQAFRILLNAGSFAGWRYEQTGWIEDPWPGQDVPND